MYLRRIRRTNQDGTVVRYIQSAHNVWDPAKKTPLADVTGPAPDPRHVWSDRAGRDPTGRRVGMIPESA